MENNSYFVFGLVTKIEAEDDASYIILEVINTSDEDLKGLKEFGIGIINKENHFEINQKVLIVFNSENNCATNFFVIK